MDQVAKKSLGQALRDGAVDHRVRITAGLILWLCLQNLILGNLPGRIAPLSNPVGVVAAALMLGGLLLRSWSAGTLRKGRELTTWGPYRLCRHPLYLGSILVMAGFCVLIPDVWNVAVMAGLIGVSYGLTMRREERRLAERYGGRWERYAAATPRLLPITLPAGIEGEWSFAQWCRSREYRAALSIPLAVLAAELWHSALALS
jgi:protein-S-isoprenylcysteine O-methyltransferase Ste14